MDPHSDVETPEGDIQNEAKDVVVASAGMAQEEDADDAVDNSPDVLLLLGQFRDIAAHPKTRNQLIQDSTSLGGLVLLLSDPKLIIVEHTLEIFMLLSKSKDCCQALFHQLGFIESLDNIVIEYGDRREDGGNIARMAVQILNKLTARPPRPHSPASSNSSRKSEESRKRDHRTSAAHHRRSFDSTSSSNLHHSSHLQPSSVATASSSSAFARPPSIKVQKQKSNSKTVTLQIKGLLDVHDRDSCREKLLEVKGVVSLTFDMKLKRAVLRVKNDLRAEDLVVAVRQTQTMSASQVVFDGDGNETLISFAHLSLDGDNASGGENDAEDDDVDYPDYLSDADELPSPEKGDKAMSRVKGEVDDGSSWFSSVSSFVKDAFYW